MRPAGSPWWREINERLLRDGCEAVALVGDLPGEPSSPTVRHWLSFIATPTARNWYRAHNASIAASYLAHRELAAAESAPERFFMNVALARVLYAHALLGAPRLALGRFARTYLVGEHHLGRMLDYAVVAPRLQQLYEWSADELSQPRLLELVRDGSPTYVWPFEERHVWRSPHMPPTGRVLERATRPR
jgi:hypothetical protein